MSEEVRLIEVGQIAPSPYQPRVHFNEESLSELAASIRQQGVIQPIIVRPLASGYELIAGERRLRATRLAGLPSIPAIVRRYTNEQALEAALIENLQREDISVVETARAYQRLADEFHYNHGEIALRTGKSRSAITNTLRLLQLPDPILGHLSTGNLTEGHARALLMLPYPSLQIEMAEWIIRNAVTVREAEERAKALGSGTAEAPRTASKPRTTPDVHVQALEDRLREHFGTRVALTYRKGKGTLSIDFYDDDDLHRLLDLLGIAEVY